MLPVDWSQMSIYIFLLLVVSALLAEGLDPSFTTSPQNKTVSHGDRIVFNCAVQNQGTRAVEWWYLDHKVQISTNQHIITADERYMIVRPHDGDGYWNLLISEVRESDAGAYECKIVGNPLTQISRLTIHNAPVAPTPSPGSLPKANFTSCCVKEGVSSACQPICDTATTNLETFDYISNCLNDVDKLVKCGSADRNHVPCCRQRLVPSECLSLCAGEVPKHDAAIYCLSVTPAVLRCFQEGQHLLPTPPTRLAAVSEAAYQISVTWQPPRENMASITGYRIFYQQDSAVVYNSTTVLSPVQLHYTLMGLRPSTLYNLYMTALNLHGSSLPTYVEQLVTKSKNLPDGADKDIFVACCRERLVKDDCLPLLCQEPENPSAADTSVLHCFTEVDKVFRCMQSERNHTGCCRQRGIPAECEPMCSGSISSIHSSNLHCLGYMQKISTCFNEGKIGLPGPPRGVTVSEVSHNGAVVTWDVPSERPDLVQEYVLEYWHLDTDHMKRFITTGNTLNVPLLPSTLYHAQVTSFGTSGRSIPSPAVVFLTYDLPAMQPTTLAPDPNARHNLTVCCTQEKANKNIIEQCMQFCSYTADFSKTDLATYQMCESSLGSLLMCGSGGRNHTACCRQSQVPDHCLDFCAFDREMAETAGWTWEHVNCQLYMPDIQQCMMSGIENLPSQPQHFYVKSRTNRTVELAWQPPLYNAAKVEGYVVLWQPINSASVQPSHSANTSMVTYILQNLKPDTEYQVRVYTYNGEGRSIPAGLIRVRTFPDYLPLNVTVADNYTKCCLNAGVSGPCLGGCSGGVINWHQCGKDMNKLINCAADGGNHQPCCQRNNVPEPCLDFCSGKPDANTYFRLLCLTFTEQILTCFMSGYDTLPSPPQDLMPVEIAPSYVQISWSAPKKNGDHVWYNVYHRSVHSSPDNVYQLDENKTSPYRLDGLEPLMLYDIFVVAQNSHGTSLPTPTLAVEASAPDMTEISLTQMPKGYIGVAQKVTLTCEAKGTPTPSVEWRRNLQVFPTRDLVIDNVTAEDTGRYTCVANNGKKDSASKSLFLQVRYAPEVLVKEEKVEVPPNRYQSARLECLIRGYPEQIQWFHHGQQLHVEHDGSNRYLWQRTLEQETGVVVSLLDIRDVVTGDYGVYTCMARNTFGTHTGAIYLENPYKDPNIPTVHPANAVLNVTACCLEKKVRASCMSVCTFDIDFKMLWDLPNKYECLQEIPKFVQCAADGRNHTQCCRNHKVEPQCFPICAGNVGDRLHENQTTCMYKVTEIIDCMEDGHDNIPSEPLNLRGKLDSGYILVWWDPPQKNQYKVAYYDIHYSEKANTPEDHSMSVVSSVTRTKIYAIHSLTTYDIRVFARNHHGSSHASNTITIATQEMAPSQPYRLNAQRVSESTLLLKWNPPDNYPGAVVSYIIHFAAVGVKQFKAVNSGSHLTTYTLSGLDEGKKYSVYVTAKSSHFESMKSNVILVEMPAIKPAPQYSNPLAVGLGVTFTVIILLVIVAGFLLWYFRLRRVPHQRFTDSVSFENPGYGNHSRPPRAQITGLADYSDSANKQPTNGKLPLPESAIMKEVDTSDQGYSTLSSPKAPLANNNGDGGGGNDEPAYATLSVSHADSVDNTALNLNLQDTST